MEKTHRKIGITGIDNLTWGSHLCHFIEKKEDLFDLLISYFRNGLLENEYCLWIMPDFTKKDEINELFDKNIENYSYYISKKQIDLYSFSEWFLKDGIFEKDIYVDKFFQKYQYTLENNFDGLRYAGFINNKFYEDALAYEYFIDNFTLDRKMITICSYSTNNIFFDKILNIVNDHKIWIAKENDNLKIFNPPHIKNLEAKLKYTEAKYKNLLSNIECGVIIVKAIDNADNFIVKFINKNAVNALDISKDNFLEKDIYSLFTDNFIVESTKENLKKLYEEDIIESNSGKIKYKFSFGTKEYCFEKLISDEIAILIKEIPEYKKKELEITADLKKKDTFLKETHHRLKNDFQVLLSLLRLQAKEIGTKESNEIFEKIQNRIKIMASVHEKLYKSMDFYKIDFYDYLNDIIYQLSENYVDKMKKIKLNIEVERIFLDSTFGIYCGLIINELITNSFKYAFRDDQDGEISINFLKKDQKEYLLSIKDTGKGLPTYFDIENTNSFGLKIVKILVRQLEGKLEILNNEGLEFKICFPSKG
ncbi:MAG: hypothetical protein A2086_05405 [Spirochaetes bacterium GWD1_27_9]|nr:MAG: hypothetical protein A2Z98_15860 [Spirochaetes bacterium GWB1_27_13]OHD26130.1 MAG: hypothetical protein A2Y34_07150 [Spirochaetes bacterium GWC1_27_15]OHD31814.1 MAG: hypothetical protein A2086_05405 [Spirochaetes bacterium GWD1_27_9]